MFYYPAVLKHHTGCFSTIWLVATKGIRVPRRDFLKVNVKSTCDDIMNYVLERVPPPQHGLPRPRFSLYLSSQLQYGVILVYHRQCAILLEELHSIVGQLVKQRASQKIDLDDHGRQPLVFPDALSLMQETEGALDPLFGVMYMQHPVPSPTALIQMSEDYLREASPEHPALTSPLPLPSLNVVVDITASPDSITLREMEPLTIPITEYEGEELVDQHPETIDFLLAQTDQFPDGEVLREDVTPAEEEREIEREQRERDVDKERLKELTGSMAVSQPTTLISEDAMLPQEETDLTVQKPQTPPAELTPVSGPVLPSPPSAVGERESPELEHVSPPQVKKRKRQLIFFDPETQLSQEELQEQITNSLTETRHPSLLPPASHRGHSAADLLNNPCNFLPEPVLFLWRQAAAITPLSGLDLQVGDRGPESTDSEKEREREMVEREEERVELSPTEVQRDLAEAEMFDMSALGTLPLERSDQTEVSRDISPMYTSEREGSIISRGASTLQDIPEVGDDLLPRTTVESPGVFPEVAEHDEAPMYFHSLLPPDANRRVVSRAFQRLLECLSSRKLCVEQREPFGDILILPGSCDVEHLTA